jgi:transposase-like protein
MAKPIARDSIYKGRRFRSETIELRVDRCCVPVEIWMRPGSRNAVAKNGFHWPTTVNLGGNAASHRELRFLGKEDSRWRSVSVRFCRYLNNIVEQDHRAIKRR